MKDLLVYSTVTRFIFHLEREQFEMNVTIFKKKLSAMSALLFIASVSITLAKENIIQEEKISFEKCLQVIETSENKLSIAPEINQVSDHKRVAVFTLVDGTLSITCDGIKGLVTVSTITN